MIATKVQPFAMLTRSSVVWSEKSNHIAWSDRSIHSPAKKAYATTTEKTPAEMLNACFLVMLTFRSHGDRQGIAYQK